MNQALELQNQILVAKDEQFNSLSEFAVEVHKLINGLIKDSRKYI